MIDWISVGFSALWISGLGLMTAALSMYAYIGSEKKWRLKKLFGTPPFRIMIYLGLDFFCIGWTGIATVAWERVVWGILALIFSIRIFQDRKLSRA